MRTPQELQYFFENDIVKLLEQIHEDTEAKWGTMDAHRMVEHLTLGFKIANGKIRIPEAELDPRSPKLKRLFLLSDKPLPKDFQNPILPKGLSAYENESLKLAIQKLLDEVAAFIDYFKMNPEDESQIHNLFGNLNYHEWLWFEYKHVMHHMMQFGIVPFSEIIE